MLFALVLLALLEPSPADAPWRCVGYAQDGDLLVRVLRHLTPDGRPAGDFVFWEPGRGEASWQMEPGPATGYALDSLGFSFTLERRPERPLWLRVEADGRVVSRIPVRPRIYDDSQRRPRADVTLVRSPHPYHVSAGRVPAIGWARRITGTLAEEGGAVLGTVSFSLPDEETLGVRAGALREIARAKAADYRRQCSDMRSVLAAPPPRQP